MDGEGMGMEWEWGWDGRFNDLLMYLGRLIGATNTSLEKPV